MFRVEFGVEELVTFPELGINTFVYICFMVLPWVRCRKTKRDKIYSWENSAAKLDAIVDSTSVFNKTGKEENYVKVTV